MFRELFTKLTILREMAFDSGWNDKHNYSAESDWEYYRQPKNRRFIKLVKKNLPGGHKVYKTKNTYFLVSKEENYLGKIEVSKVDKEAGIASSHSSTKGLYAILFPVMLHDFDFITSGTSLSSQAIKSYEKLNKTGVLKVQIQTLKGIKPFSKKLLLSDISNTVLISEDYIQKFYRNYYERINTIENGRPSGHRIMFLENNPQLERYLYGDLLENF